MVGVRQRLRVGIERYARIDGELVARAGTPNPITGAGSVNLSTTTGGGRF